MKKILYSIGLLFCISSCDDNSIPQEKKTEAAPTTPCNEINHCLISYGFEYKNIRVVIFRTYKKGSDFKDFIKEYKFTMDRDYLAELKPDSWENRRIERDVYIPDEITSDVDFMLVTADSLKYKITDLETNWIPTEHGGYRCGMTSYKVNGKTGNSNIHIFRPGFYLK